MITWATTVDPQTQSFATSSSYSIVADDPNVLNSRTESRERFTISFQNWSSSSTWFSSANTRVDASPVFFQSYEAHSVRGTTNSTSAQTTITVRSLSETTVTETVTSGFFYTTRDVLNVTSGTTTSAYSYKATGTTTSAYSFPSTTQISSSTFTTATTSSAQTITTTSNKTSQDTRYTTVTTAAETVRTPVLATIVQADKDEVIWAVNTSNAVSVSGSLFAATAVGTSTTRTTIQPWIQTISAAEGSSSDTTAYTNQAITGSVAYHAEAIAPATTTVVTNYSRIPNQTETSQVQSLNFASAGLSFTVVPSEAITATIAVSYETLVTNTTRTWSGLKIGQSYSSTHQQTTTLTRRYAPTWVSSSTETLTDQVVGYTATTTKAGNQTTVTGSYYWTQSFTTSDSNELTSFARSPAGISTAQTPNLVISREAQSGVVDENGDVVLGYTCQDIGSVFGIVTASVSRNVRSFIPQTLEYYNSNGSQIGSMTISGLAVTAKASSQTAGTTFSLQPFGAAILTQQALDSASAFDASFLGRSESVYQTLDFGVYSSSNTTFSTTIHASFLESEGQSRPALIPLSYVRASPAAQNLENPFTWTVKRNHHPSSTALTGAAAYSAS